MRILCINVSMSAETPGKIIFIRHAQSFANLKKLPMAQARKAKLTEEGVKQVNNLSQSILKHDEFGILDSSICFVSGFKRSQETAEYLLGKIGLPLPIQVDARLNELELSRRSFRSLVKLANRKGADKAFAMRTRNKNLQEHFDEARAFVSHIRQIVDSAENVLIVGHALKGLFLRMALLKEGKSNFFTLLKERPGHCNPIAFCRFKDSDIYTLCK